jgi:transposase
MNHMGLDLHKSYSYIVVLDDSGTLIDQRRLANDAVAPYLKKVEAPVQVTFEATYNWQYMYEQLDGLAAQVVLAHPKQVRAIASARIKHDRIDARVLAELLRTNLLPTFPGRKPATCGTWSGTGRICPGSEPG